MAARFYRWIKKTFVRWSEQRHLWIVLIVFLATSGILYLGLMFQAPELKPLRSPTPPKKVQRDYLICVATQEITTGYTEPAWGPPAASAHDYYVGSVAVHPLVSTAWGGDPRQPIIPFGTQLHLLRPSSIRVGGKWFDTLTVVDTGDVNLGLWPDNPYWFDIYFGPTGYWTDLLARAYGTRKVDYYWVEEWR